MGWGYVGRLADRIREREAANTEAFAVRSQASLMRGWVRLPQWPSQEQVNPAGRAYLQARPNDPSLRPSNFMGRIRKLAEENQRRQQRALQQLAPIAQQMNPWEISQLTGIREAAEIRRQTPEQFVSDYQQAPEYGQQALSEQV